MCIFARPDPKAPSARPDPKAPSRADRGRCVVPYRNTDWRVCEGKAALTVASNTLPGVNGDYAINSIRLATSLQRGKWIEEQDLEGLGEEKLQAIRLLAFG
jgi:hypothetical protein